MNEIINQVKRMFYDNGRNDKDFSKEEMELSIAKKKLDEAIEEFQRTANKLYSTLLKVD